jgi:hypothetical protein
MIHTTCQSNSVMVRDGILLANGDALRLDHITDVTERQSTRPSRGSDRAFVVMLTSGVVGAASVHLFPLFGGVLLGIMLFAWYFAWCLRAPCRLVIVHESNLRQVQIRFDESRAARRLLDELSQATGGRLHARRIAQLPMRRRRVTYARGMRPVGIAVFFFGGAILYGSGERDVGGIIMALSGIAFVVDWLFTIATWLINLAAARPRTRPPRDVCATCGYSLIGNVSGICPECGTKIRAA